MKAIIDGYLFEDIEVDEHVDLDGIISISIGHKRDNSESKAFFLTLSEKERFEVDLFRDDLVIKAMVKPTGLTALMQDDFITLHTECVPIIANNTIVGCEYSIYLN